VKAKQRTVSLSHRHFAARERPKHKHHARCESSTTYPPSAICHASQRPPWRGAPARRGDEGTCQCMRIIISGGPRNIMMIDASVVRIHKTNNEDNSQSWLCNQSSSPPRDRSFPTAGPGCPRSRTSCISLPPRNKKESKEGERCEYRHLDNESSAKGRVCVVCALTISRQQSAFSFFLVVLRLVVFDVFRRRPFPLQ
jgi:hypothetical protein